MTNFVRIRDKGSKEPWTYIYVGMKDLSGTTYLHSDVEDVADSDVPRERVGEYFESYDRDIEKLREHRDRLFHLYLRLKQE